MRINVQQLRHIIREAVEDVKAEMELESELGEKEFDDAAFDDILVESFWDTAKSAVGLGARAVGLGDQSSPEVSDDLKSKMRAGIERGERAADVAKVELGIGELIGSMVAAVENPESIGLTDVGAMASKMVAANAALELANQMDDEHQAELESKALEAMRKNQEKLSAAIKILARDAELAGMFKQLDMMKKKNSKAPKGKKPFKVKDVEEVSKQITARCREVLKQAGSSVDPMAVRGAAGAGFAKRKYTPRV